METVRFPATITAVAVCFFINAFQAGWPAFSGITVFVFSRAIEKPPFMEQYHKGGLDANFKWWR